MEFDQSTDLSDYSKFYQEDKENMIELFFDIFKELKMNDSIDLTDLSTTDYSETDLSFDFSSDLPLSKSSSDLSESSDLELLESSSNLKLLESSDLELLESSSNLKLLESSDLELLESSSNLKLLESSDLSESSDLELLESSSDLPLNNYEMYDFYQEPVNDFVFDENEIYRDNSNDLIESNLPYSLIKTYDSITEKALAIEKLYKRIRNKINDFKYQTDDLIRCISALNRIVITLDLHLPKLCLLAKLSNLKINIKEYKEFLYENQCTSLTNSIQQMIDLFYTSYLEFDITVKNCKTTDELMNHSNKLQSNLEYLRTVYPEYKNLKKRLPFKVYRLRSSIKLLRYNIVKDLIDIIIQLTSDESYQLFNGFTQNNLLFSFKRLLKSIS